MLRTLLLIVAVVVVAALGLVIDAQSRPPARLPASGASVPRQRIFASGRVEGATEEIELRTQLASRVVAMPVREGLEVAKGDVLLKLDNDQFRHEVELAEAEVLMAEAQLERLVNGAHRHQRDEGAAMYRAKQAELRRAKLAWKRIARLRDENAIAAQEADNQETLVEALTAEVAAAKSRLELLTAPARDDEVRLAKARIAAARSKLELAGVPLARTELHAPCAGRVLKVNVESGELTGPDSPLPAVIMADTSRLRVRAFVEELDAPRVEVGMTAKIVADGLPGREFPAHVAQTSPRMTHKRLATDHPAERLDTKVREIWLDLDGDAAGLVVGLLVDVIVNVGETKSASPDEKERN